MKQIRIPHSNRTLCPHCGGVCDSIRTNQLSPLVREIHYRCRNEACGHIFVAEIQAVRTVAPSFLPNPDVHLPVIK